MKNVFGPCLLSLAIAASAAHATGDFGTADEADELADGMIQIIDERGITGAAEALFDPSLPFSGTRMGINLFQGSILVGDNREPEMVQEDYGTITDLNGKRLWQAMLQGYASGDEFMLNWYHYETQAPYDFTCVARYASDPTYSVMICR